MSKKTAKVTKPDAPGAQRTLQDNLVVLVWQRLASVLDDVRIGRAVKVDEDKLTCTVEYMKGRKRLQASDENVPLRLYTGGGDVGRYAIPEDESPVVLVMVDGERPALMYVARPIKIIWKSTSGLELRADAKTGKIELKSVKQIAINDGSGGLRLRADAKTGKVELRGVAKLRINDGSHPAVRGDTLEAWYNTVKAAHDAHVHTGPNGPPAAQLPEFDTEILNATILID